MQWTSLDALATLAFVLFAGTAARVALVPPGAPARRRLAHVLLLATLPWLAAAPALQRDLWPFACWPVAAGPVPAEITRARLLAVDAAGGEHPIDPRAWRPLGFDELNPWLQLRFPALPRAQRDAAAAWLLARAEEARRQARAGQGLPRARLGPLAAPTLLQHARPWGEGEGAPREPFTGLRLYLETWPAARSRAEARRTLAYAFP